MNDMGVHPSNNVKDVVKFCAKNNIVLLSDEILIPGECNVYHTGIDTFYSARRAANELGLIDNDSQRLAYNYAHSIPSQRGYLVNVVNVNVADMSRWLGWTDKDVIDILYKLTAASKLCSSLYGQAGHGQLDVLWTSPRGCFVPLSRGRETSNL
jgi:hypothetical protein